MNRFDRCLIAFSALVILGAASDESAAATASFPVGTVCVPGVIPACEPAQDFTVTTVIGLQNPGDATYQLNWATLKSYAGSCRRVQPDLGERNPDGTVFYRTADFQFTR